VVVAELLEASGVALKGSLRLGTTVEPPRVLLGFVLLQVKVRAPGRRGRVAPRRASSLHTALLRVPSPFASPLPRQGPSGAFTERMAYGKLPGRRNYATRGDALRMAGAGLCRQAGALPHKLRIAWDPPAVLPLRIPNTRKTRDEAMRRRAERDASKGGADAHVAGEHCWQEAGVAACSCHPLFLFPHPQA
jgi:hypothetical protein